MTFASRHGLNKTCIKHKGEEEMKKLMLMVGVLMMAVAVMAAGNVKLDASAYATIAGLQSAKDTAGLKAFLGTLAPDTATEKLYVAATLIQADYIAGVKVANIDACKALAMLYASQVGITTPEEITAVELQAVYYASDMCSSAGIAKADAYTFYKAIATPTDAQKEFGMYLAYYSGDVANALAIGESQLNKSYVVLSMMSSTDPVKCFGYSKKALLSSTLSVAQVTEILTRLWGFDFSDTTITPQMQYDMLCAVNGKYSQMLVTDKANWESIVTRIQMAISALKLQLGK